MSTWVRLHPFEMTESQANLYPQAKSPFQNSVVFYNTRV